MQRRVHGADTMVARPTTFLPLLAKRADRRTERVSMMSRILDQQKRKARQPQSECGSANGMTADEIDEVEFQI